MDRQIAGPSRPKRVCTDYEKKRHLSDKELEELAEAFSDSGSEFELSDLESESSFESDLEIPQFDDKLDETRTPIDNIPVEPEILTWTDLPNMKYIQFSGNPGLLVPVPGSDPFDFFSLLVTDDFLLHVVEQTNLYAEEVFLSESTREKSRITTWTPLDLSEFKVFLGLWFHMGNIKINRMQDYWKTDDLFNLSCFPKHMSRNRFLLILRCLHFDKNPSQDEPRYGDRLHKIRFMQDYLNQKMAEIYYPKKNLSIDESMVLWRGRLAFRQYIKGKRHKYGMKLYVLAEPNGLVLRNRLYSGAAGDLGGKDHAHKVVLSLIEGLQLKGHALYMDNYYNSFSLCQKLLDIDVYVTGTLRKERKLNPKDVVTAKLKKGEAITKYCKGVAVSKWHDKRDVLLISTEFENSMIEVERRHGENVQKPLAIVRYNENMSGVDRQDQMLSYYPSERKTLRWYKKLGIHILCTLLLNSYILFKIYSANKMSYYDFRITVIKKLLSFKQTKEQTYNKAGVKTTGSHYPQKSSNDSGRAKRKRCKMCYSKNIRKDTPYFCPDCPDSPGLCLENCFQEYHK